MVSFCGRIFGQAKGITLLRKPEKSRQLYLRFRFDDGHIQKHLLIRQEEYPEIKVQVISQFEQKELSC